LRLEAMARLCEMQERMHEGATSAGPAGDAADAAEEGAAEGAGRAAALVHGWRQKAFELLVAQMQARREVQQAAERARRAEEALRSVRRELSELQLAMTSPVPRSSLGD
jgi:hypothetical protein